MTRNSKINLDRLQNKCTNCKGIKNNTNFGQNTRIQENLDTTCKYNASKQITQRLNLGRVSSPLCVNELGLACNQTQLCQLGVFIDCVEQLHVSAFIGHRQVVLREMNKLH